MRKFHKITINNIELHSKRLIVLWQHDHFKNKDIKLTDGTFISSNIFSVYVYSTPKEISIVKELAIQVNDKISDLIGDCRDYIRKEQQKLNHMTTSIIAVPFVMPDPILIKIDHNKLTPSVLALIKLYIAIDKHIIAANKAKNDGDISSTQCAAFQNHAIKRLTVLLTKIQKICSQFHKLRKENS